MYSKKQAIADTGYFLGLFNEKDAHHEQVVRWETGFGDDYALVTTCFVIFEVYQSILKPNPKEARHFIDCINEEEAVQVIPFSADWIAKAKCVMDKYADKKLDLTDISIVLLADMLQIGDILTVDRRDFGYLCWHENSRRFNNLLDAF